MASHVGITVVGGLPPKDKAIAEGLGGQPHEASRILTLSFEQGKPRCMSVLLTGRIIYILCLQMYCTLRYRF
jgi:hypothetical protein